MKLGIWILGLMLTITAGSTAFSTSNAKEVDSRLRAVETSKRASEVQLEYITNTLIRIERKLDKEKP